MATYRIHTENKNPDEIEKIIKKRFGDSYTITKETDGFWRVQKRDMTIVEVQTSEVKKDFQENF